jgi:hypothetical protein
MRVQFLPRMPTYTLAVRYGATPPKRRYVGASPAEGAKYGSVAESVYASVSKAANTTGSNPGRPTIHVRGASLVIQRAPEERENLVRFQARTPVDAE